MSKFQHTTRHIIGLSGTTSNRSKETEIKGTFIVHLFRVHYW